MGPTREKKLSKRAIKAQKHVAELDEELEKLAIASPSTKLIEFTPTSTLSVPSHSLLAASKPSAKSSRSSLRTDRSAESGISDISSSINPTAKPYDPSLIEVVSTPDRGYAVYTTTKIPAGTLILVERPIIRLTAAEESSHSHSIQDILAQYFNALSRSSQKSYFKLHNSEKASFSRVKSIYFSNCYDLGKSDTGSVHGGSAIGLLASRINHSCIPNVQFSFADEIPSHLGDIVRNDSRDASSKSNGGLMLFYTLRSISARRELLANYDSVYMASDERQVKQQMYYGFRCTCEACTGKTEFWAKSDERRKEMSQLKARIDKEEKRWGREHEVSLSTDNPSVLPKELSSQEGSDVVLGVLSALERLATLLVKEGITGMDLVQLYRALSRWSLRAGQEVESRHWSEKEQHTAVIAFGNRDHSIV